MKGEFDNSAPIFQQIADHMLGEIAKGILAPGEKVAAVRALAVEYKVNPNTMQKSLEKLGEMGYLYTERTSGRFVTEDISKIEALRQEIPKKMTAAYVGEMLDFGIEAQAIVSHVEKFINERKERDGQNIGN